MPCVWEGNRRPGVALAMRRRLQWFIHLPAQGLGKGDEHRACTPHGAWHTLPFNQDNHNRTLNSIAITLNPQRQMSPVVILGAEAYVQGQMSGGGRRDCRGDGRGRLSVARVVVACAKS